MIKRLYQAPKHKHTANLQTIHQSATKLQIQVFANSQV